MHSEKSLECSPLLETSTEFNIFGQGLSGAPHLGRLAKFETRLERLAKDKHSSLLRTFVNYGVKSFYNIGPSIDGGAAKSSNSNLLLSIL